MIDLTVLKPNELIRLAITDMKKTIEQGVRIDMTAWGIDLDSDICSVCFAGSIMLQEGQQPDVVNNCFDLKETDINFKQFKALDCIRQGNLLEFCQILNVAIPKIAPMPEYMLNTIVFLLNIFQDKKNYFTSKWNGLLLYLIKNLVYEKRNLYSTILFEFRLFFISSKKKSKYYC